jgi:hypothetical protein
MWYWTVEDRLVNLHWLVKIVVVNDSDGEYEVVGLDREGERCLLDRAADAQGATQALSKIYDFVNGRRRDGEE